MDEIHPQRRRYELGKRLEQMDDTRATILRAARKQLEENGYRQLTMSSLAAESGITRQTVHNLFGTKSAVLEALFDVIAIEGGMENMREVMIQTSAETMLERFIELFCSFWTAHRLLIRRVHGIAAIDPEFGTVIEARNRRRLAAATRVVSRSAVRTRADERAAALAAISSFEFFDAVAENAGGANQAARIMLDLARKVLSGE